MVARLTKYSVVIFFCVMTTLLVLRQPAFTVQSAEDLGTLSTIAAQNGPVWSGIYFVDKKSGKRTKIGYAKSETVKETAGYIISSESRLKITAQGTEAQVRMLSKTLTDLDNRLLSIDFSMLSDTIKFELFGRVEKGKLNLEIKTAGAMQYKVIDMPPNTVLPETMLAEAARKGLEVGQVVTVPFFDPTSFNLTETQLKVVEKVKLSETDDAIVYHLSASYSGIMIEAWVDEKGQTLREEAAGILTKVETEKQALTSGWGKGAPTDLIDQVAVKTKKKIKNPRALRSLKLALRGIDMEAYSFEDHRQTLTGNVVAIKIEEGLDSPTTIPLPSTGFEEFLKGTPTIQKNDPAIKAKAFEIVAKEKNALKAARAISDWVYRTLEKKPLISIPSARDILEIKRGDCNEHATLYTALARAAGIPTRIEVGLVYFKNGFYYHAWNAVYVGQWVSLDATFGQFPADATHLKVLSGDLDAQIPILNMIGNLEIDIMSD
jgi:Transglutaminase-like superfamily